MKSEIKKQEDGMVFPILLVDPTDNMVLLASGYSVDIGSVEMGYDGTVIHMDKTDFHYKVGSFYKNMSVSSFCEVFTGKIELSN